MGTLRYHGPVYGAKSLLATVTRASVAANASALELLQIDIPSTEDWYITEVYAYCTNQGNGGTVDVKDDAVSVLPAAVTLASNASAKQTCTADGGEDEGKKVAGGSSLTVNASDGATTAIADLVVHVMGYIRKADTP